MATEQFPVRSLPSAERIRELLAYDPKTGEFRYRERVARRVRVGDLAGSINTEGYRHIRVDGRLYKAHRLALLIATGAWPEGLVDHINGDRSDNRLCNLRPCSRSENIANSAVYRKGKQAAKGVRLTPRGWSARIQRGGVQHFLGYHDSEAAAASAYLAAAQRLFGPFAKGAQL